MQASNLFACALAKRRFFVHTLLVYLLKLIKLATLHDVCTLQSLTPIRIPLFMQKQAKYSLINAAFKAVDIHQSEMCSASRATERFDSQLSRTQPKPKLFAYLKSGLSNRKLRLSSDVGWRQMERGRREMPFRARLFSHSFQRMRIARSFRTLCAPVACVTVRAASRHFCALCGQCNRKYRLFLSCLIQSEKCSL